MPNRTSWIPWLYSEEEQLRRLKLAGKTLREMASEMPNRTTGAIRRKLQAMLLTHPRCERKRASGELSDAVRHLILDQGKTDLEAAAILRVSRSTVRGCRNRLALRANRK